MITFLTLTNVEPQIIEELLDAAFGSDRHGRTAYHLREGSIAIAALSFAIASDTKVIASIQCWPVKIGEHKLIMVGPVAVDPRHQNAGHGKQLMLKMLEAAEHIGNPPMMMIGDPEYYGRFGFTASETSGWTLPGPWEPQRLLARNPGGHALPAMGMVERADAL